MFLAKGIRSESLDVYLAVLLQHLELTDVYVFITDKYPLGSVSDLEASGDIKVKPKFG